MGIVLSVLLAILIIGLFVSIIIYPPMFALLLLILVILFLMNPIRGKLIQSGVTPRLMTLDEPNIEFLYCIGDIDFFDALFDFKDAVVSAKPTFRHARGGRFRISNHGIIYLDECFTRDDQKEIVRFQDKFFRSI